MHLAHQATSAQVAIDLLVRQAAFLGLLALLGSGPAALLSRRFDLATRVALAPALGLALGVCVTTALIGVAPVSGTWWVLIVVALASLTVAVRQWRGRLIGRERFGRREIAQLLIVLIVAAGTIDYTLQQHRSVGPSVYLVRDVLGYIADVDSMEHLSLPDAAALKGRHLGNLEDQYWSIYAAGYQNLDATPLEASADELFGLHATDTIASYMLVLILVGALGAFAAVRFAMGSRTWVAALAGALFGGPFYMQLFFDGSQAAICGTVLVLPLALAGWDAIRGGGRVRDLAIVALLAGALLAVYPLFAPAVGGAAGLVLLWLAAGALRRGRLRAAARDAWWRIGAVVAFAALFSNVAFARDLRYWHAVLTKTQLLPQLSYHFSLPIMPPWLLQTGEFANIPNFVVDPSRDALLKGAVIPALLGVLICVGLLRRRAGFALLGVVLIAAGLAEYARRSQGCEYCIDRNVLPIAPIAIALVAIGIASLAASARRWPGAVAALASLLVIVPTALATRSEHQRFREYNYFLDAAVRALVAQLPAHPGPIELEGFNEDITGPSEYAAVYDLLAERGFTVSAPVEGDDYSADAYMASPRPPGPEFHPYYRWVLTRYGAVATGRTVVARSGGLALERRTAPLDVTTYAGLGLPLPRLDPGGVVWVQPQLTPFRLYVVGGRGAAAVWVHVTLHSDVPLGLEVGIKSRVQPNGSIVACVPATGRAPIRRAVLYMSGQLNPPPAIGTRYGLPMPVEDIQLTGMRAETGHCTL